MGRETVNTVLKNTRCELVGAIDRTVTAADVGEYLGIGHAGVPLHTDLMDVLMEQQADVLVDFTNPEAVSTNVERAIGLGIRPIIGTTGIDQHTLENWDGLLRSAGIGGILAPNFAIGAILQMRFAAMAARYFPHIEMIELHHDKKLDAPSGTALKTAEMIQAQRSSVQQGHPDEVEKLPGARGAQFEGMRIHSVRLPGYIAHQEVLFGGLGQSLTIRHDVISREEAYMPGVNLAIERVLSVTGLIYGLEHIID